MVYNCGFTYKTSMEVCFFAFQQRMNKCCDFSVEDGDVVMLAGLEGGYIQLLHQDGAKFKVQLLLVLCPYLSQENFHLSVSAFRSNVT